MKKRRYGNIILCGLLFLVSCSNKEEEQVVEETPVFIEEEQPKAKEDTRVSFMAVGDNLIHGAIYYDARQEDGSYDFTPMYELVAPTAMNSDIAFINQETMLGGNELGLSSYPVFSSPTEIAKNLESSGFDIANLATNHSLDIGSAGVESTRNAFKNTNILVDGIYTSEEQYKDIVLFERDGITFSFLAYTYGTNGIIPEYDYEVSYLDEGKIRSDVKRAKELSDVVIVSAHWGNENVFIENEEQEFYADLFTELEVDLVVGTHPHVIQPVKWKEKENGSKTLIIYSLGNFIGAMATVENAIGGMVQLDFVKDKDTNNIAIENVKWDTVFTHFERVSVDSLDGSKNFKVYPLSEYSDTLAQIHALNGFAGQVVTTKYIEDIVNNVIDDEFLK